MTQNDLLGFIFFELLDEENTYSQETEEEFEDFFDLEEETALEKL